MLTPNISLDEIAENQASKYLTHNAALRRIDVLLQAIVEDKDLTTPPAPIDGELYIVAEDATGDWLNHDNQLAYAMSGAWEFITPKPDWRVYVRDEKSHYCFNGTYWERQTMGNIDMNHHVLSKPAIKNYSEITHNLGNIAGTVNIDYENGNFQYGILTDNVTISISNPPVSGTVGTLTLELQQDATGNHTIIWPGSVQFAQGIAPTLSATPHTLDVFVLYTRDGGATYRLGTAGLDFS